MNTSNAAHKPSDIEAQYKGETRAADGYQYWTTSEEDEDSLDIREQVASGAYEAEAKKKKKVRRKLLEQGAGKRTVIRLVSLFLLLFVAALIYLVFNYVQVSDAAGTDTTQPADAIIVLGAAQYNGTPSKVLQERLDHAFNLYELYKDEGVPPLIFVTGAGADGEVNTEGLAGMVHLLNKGVPEEAIVPIPEGKNSWEQISASAFQIQELQLDSVLLVSDSYHTKRLLDIADEIIDNNVEVFVSPSAVEPTFGNYFRESMAVGIGRITGYRRLSALTER